MIKGLLDKGSGNMCALWSEAVPGHNRRKRRSEEAENEKQKERKLMKGM